MTSETTYPMLLQLSAQEHAALKRVAGDFPGLSLGQVGRMLVRDELVRLGELEPKDPAEAHRP